MDETSEQEAVPWYRDYSSSNPFRLYRKFCIPDKDPRNQHPDRFRTVAAFPWTRESHKSLWNDRKLEINSENWKKMVDEYSDAILVGSERQVYVFWLHSARRPLSIELPPQPKSNDRIVPTDKTHVSWALSPDVLYQPFVIFSDRYLLYTYSFQTKTVNTILRGHGGHITSIALHPSLPHLFATTSRDFSVRVYDLTQKPREHADNPIWPPRTTPSLAGPAHGLDINGKEGTGMGRCVLILMGGRSGGHMGDVFAASFHRHYPIIATCGMDRTVKIWHIPTITPGAKTMREDKPLFSASRIHTARVLSIDWLSDDLLLSHSAPPLLATSNDSSEDEEHSEDEETKPTEYTVGAGQMVLWRWLGLDRFFPPGWDEYETRQEVLRGCASDYQESASYKIITSVDFPLQRTQYDTPSFHLFCEPRHDPLVLYSYPGSKMIRILNIADFKPRKPPPCPWPEHEMINALTLDDDDADPSCWEIVLDGMHNTRSETLETCAMCMEGSTVVGAGSRSIWLWSASS